MTTLLRDTLDMGSGQELHQADSGRWQIVAAGEAGAFVNGDRLESRYVQRRWGEDQPFGYSSYAGPEPSSADYAIAAVLHVKTLSHSPDWIIGGRWDAETGEAVGVWIGAKQGKVICELRRFADFPRRSPEVLGSFEITEPGDHLLTLALTGETITARLDGEERLRGTGSRLTAAGRPGLACRGEQAGIELGSILIEDGAEETAQGFGGFTNG